MKAKELAAHIDHTLLRQTATADEVLALCDEAMRWHCASVCVSPCRVKLARERLADAACPKVCTVVGFPNGDATTDVKIFAARQALFDGAEEIDMVANLGWVRQGAFDQVTKEIAALKQLCGKQVLKVIIETGLLTNEEKIALCACVTNAGADFIKTSTGFAKGGATVADVALLRAHVGPQVRVKAAGGISTLAEGLALLAAGADRLGTSRLVPLLKGMEPEDELL